MLNEDRFEYWMKITLKGWGGHEERDMEIIRLFSLR